VLKDRVNKEYLEPLKRIEVRNRGETELFLGLVHTGDVEGTRKRIKTTEKVLGDRFFRVSTECR
jgi:hypothetical protein